MFLRFKKLNFILDKGELLNEVTAGLFLQKLVFFRKHKLGRIIDR